MFLRTLEGKEKDGSQTIEKDFRLMKPTGMAGMKKTIVLITAGLLLFIAFEECFSEEIIPLGMAVEFTNHAAGAYICRDMGWFEEEGLALSSYESYVTGMSLASALARGDIQVAYMCLVPAINVFANAKIPLRIIAGTHKYGYGLVVNPDKIQNIEDLENRGIRIGCAREGGTVDVLLHKTIDTYNLDKEKILKNIRRMNPPKQILAIKTGQLDAAFLPEQWATVAEEFGFSPFLMSREIWPEVQGSVLVVKEELIKEHPDMVKKLVNVSMKANDWINLYPQAAAEIVAGQLQAVDENLFPVKAAGLAAEIEITPDVLLRSMNRLEYTTDIDPVMVREIIDYVAQLGYIKNSFDSEDILDLSFLE